MQAHADLPEAVRPTKRTHDRARPWNETVHRNEVGVAVALRSGFGRHSFVGRGFSGCRGGRAAVLGARRRWPGEEIHNEPQVEKNKCNASIHRRVRLLQEAPHGQGDTAHQTDADTGQGRIGFRL